MQKSDGPQDFEQQRTSILHALRADDRARWINTFIVTSCWRIDGDVKLNSALWVMTENMLDLFSQYQAKKHTGSWGQIARLYAFHSLQIQIHLPFTGISHIPQFVNPDRKHARSISATVITERKTTMYNDTALERNNHLNHSQKESTEDNLLHAIVVPDEMRLSFWPQHFGSIPQWITLEPHIFAWMDRFCTDYGGGIWRFYTLSNGGAFAAPDADSDEVWSLLNNMNGNSAEMSAEAAGIAVCLIEFSHHACRTECDAMTEHYYRLRDYALNHPESFSIFAIID